MASELESIDTFLEYWDRFAQGENQLVPYIKKLRPEFERQLAERLIAGNAGAPARMVFYAVVQVGGFIDLATELGKAAHKVVGADFPVFESKEGKRALFAGELFFWWRDNLHRFERYPLFDEWMERDFAQSVVIPMYQATHEQK